MDGFQTQALPALRRRKPKLWTAPFRQCRLGDVLLCRQRVHRRTMDRLPLNGLGTQRGSVNGVETLPSSPVTRTPKCKAMEALQAFLQTRAST